MNTGIVFVKRANAWQVYIKEVRTKMNNKDTTLNKEFWFAAEEEAEEKLEEIRSGLDKQFPTE